VELFFFFIFWSVLAAGIAGWAGSWGRSALGYFFLSFIFSPILAAIVLAIAGNKDERERKEQARADEQKREHERQIESIRAITLTAAAPAAAPVGAPSARSVADELEKLFALRDKGALTAEEFAEEKAVLLASRRPPKAPPATTTVATVLPPPAPVAVGTCPHCHAVIPLASASCPHCTASFAEGAAWKVKPV
jgi:hypothetical protein